MGDPSDRSGADPKGQGRWRRTLHRWAEGDSPSGPPDAQARERRRKPHRDGRDRPSIADAPDRDLVTLRGTLRSVTVRPRGGVPALEAELSDGSGVLTLVWLGRRRIAGIDAGRGMLVTGRIGRHGQEQTRILYNPRYELLS